MPERHSTKELFYGYPAAVIAEWCHVSLQSAYHYKNGIRKPSPQVLALFELHASGRVLGREWTRWAVNKDKLYDPEGHEMTQGQLRAYALVWQLARELSRDKPDASSVLSRLAGFGEKKPTGKRKQQKWMQSSDFWNSTDAEREKTLGPHPLKKAAAGGR